MNSTYRPTDFEIKGDDSIESSDGAKRDPSAFSFASPIDRFEQPTLVLVLDDNDGSIGNYLLDQRRAQQMIDILEHFVANGTLPSHVEWKE